MMLDQRRLWGAAPDLLPDMSVPVTTPGIGDGLPQNQPEQPFVWGAGGARLTPEQILAREELARGQMQADFSPVGHWTQGLGRVVNNVMGAIDAKGLDKESRAANADRAAIIAQMLGDNSDLAGAFASGDPTVARLGSTILKSRLPKQASPTDLMRNYDWLSGMGRTADADALIARATQDNPWISATLPDGNFYSGPARGLATTFGNGEPKGGGQSISPMPGAVGSPPPASAGPGVPHLTVDQMGAFGSMFPQWQKREGTPVLVTSPEEMARVPAGTMVISPDGRRGVKK